MVAQVLKFDSVSLKRRGVSILDSVQFEIGADNRLVILGPNGAGKTSVLQIASTRLHPSDGEVTILDHVLGKVNVFDIRPRIGIVTQNLARDLPLNETVHDIVLTSAFGVQGRWNEVYENVDIDRADRILREWQVDHLAERPFHRLSDGERKRVLIARAVMTNPDILLLDEPTTSLDLGSRERLLGLLSAFAASPVAPAMVLVTHHVEEIPPGFTHALLLKDGKVHAFGDIDETLTNENLSELYDLPIEVEKRGGRFTAVSR